MSKLPFITTALPRYRLWSPLTLEEAPSIANGMSEKEEQLRQVRSRIQSLERELQMLKSREKGLRKDLLTYRALTAPIRILPLDILLEIFGLLCTGIHIHHTEEKQIVWGNPRYVGITTLRVPPVLLSHVCSTWNDLVKCSGPLWSTVSIELMPGNAGYSDMQRAEKALACVLSRSGNMPLHVSLRWLEDRDVQEMDRELGEMDRGLDSFLTSFFDQSYRWKTAELVMDHAEGPLAMQLRKPMPILEALSFSLETVVAPGEQGFGQFFSQTPSLQTAIFRSSYAFSRSNHLGAHLHTLVVDTDWEEVDFPSVSHAKGFLSQCTSLQTLSWDAWLESTGSSGDECPIVLPITSLRGGAELDHLLPHVLLPNIKNFNLEIPVPPSFDGSVLSITLEKYRSLITSLDVSPPYQPLNHSMRTIFVQLGSFPQLHTLRLCHYGKQGSPCDFTDIPHHFPKLKTFSYESLTEEPVFNDVANLLVAFQRSTDGSDGLPVHKVSMLQEVELDLPLLRLSPDQQSILRDIQESGLALEVRARGGRVVLEDVP